MNFQPLFFAGSSHPCLAQEICSYLQIPLGRMNLGKFPDGETSVEVLENVRGRDVFVLQSLVGDPNHYLMELLIIVDALKRASVRSIVAIIPYLGYCRQDRKNQPGVPITAKLVANLLSVSGMTKLITCDMHADQVEGFFEVPVDHLRCQQILSLAVKNWMGENYIVVAPDIGSIKTAERMAKCLQCDLAVIKKQRLNAFDVQMTLIGEVCNKNVLVADDLCSTAGTLIAAANLCQEMGACKVSAAITHGLFVGDALERIESSALEHLFITDTVDAKRGSSSKINLVSVAPMIAETIRSCRGG